jgi:hypothetical protein
MSNDKKKSGLNVMKLVKRLGMMLMVFRMIQSRRNKNNTTKQA